MKALSPLFYTACLCNNATLVESLDSAACEGYVGGSLSGQPTELALLVAADKAGLADPRPQYHRVQEIPFSSDRKRMEVKARPVNGKQACEAFLQAGLLDDAAYGGMGSVSGNAPIGPPSFLRKSFSRKKSPSFDGSLYFVKGMPEKVLGECHTYTGADGLPTALLEDDRTLVLRHSRRMASSGLRVLALAYGKSLEQLVFTGLVAMEDPPRQGVQDCVRQLRKGGVKVMMVTGDSKETALAIAHRCGILGKSDLGDLYMDGTATVTTEDLEFGSSEALSGDQLDAIPPESLADSIAGVRVFFRVVPRHKLAIVRALQSRGDIVAMTGDGVNDATALKGADIGVAMGKNGTDVAKEAADVVLADDDFGKKNPFRNSVAQSACLCRLTFDTATILIHRNNHHGDSRRQGHLFQHTMLLGFSVEHFFCSAHHVSRGNRLWVAVTSKRNANIVDQHYHGWPARAVFGCRTCRRKNSNGQAT